jgi:mannose-6-phosphate isomerase-like protein (cupin superfamily)
MDLKLIDLEEMYLSLDGQGAVKSHAVEGFWETIDSNSELLATLVTSLVSTEDWPHWEMHPAGEEVLIQLEGTMTLILDDTEGERKVELAVGSTCVVPKGIWHRAIVPLRSRFLALTYGAGTLHRPI